MTEKQIRELKVGDIVVGMRNETVNNEYHKAEITVGKEYKVTSIQFNQKIMNTCINVNNQTFAFYAKSYELVKKVDDSKNKIVTELRERLLELYEDIEQHQKDEDMTTDISDASYYQGLREAKETEKTFIKRMLDLVLDL